MTQQTLPLHDSSASQSSATQTLGTVFVDDRTDERLILCYYDSDRVLLLNNETNTVRLEPTDQYERNVKSNRYEITDTRDLDAIGTSIPPSATIPIDLTAINGIGSQTAANLKNAGFTTPAAIVNADDERLLAIDGVGKQTLKTLRQVIY